MLSLTPNVALGLPCWSVKLKENRINANEINPHSVQSNDALLSSCGVFETAFGSFFLTTLYPRSIR